MLKNMLKLGIECDLSDIKKSVRVPQKFGQFILIYPGNLAFFKSNFRTNPEVIQYTKRSSSTHRGHPLHTEVFHYTQRSSSSHTGLSVHTEVIQYTHRSSRSHKGHPVHTKVFQYTQRSSSTHIGHPVHT